MAYISKITPPSSSTTYDLTPYKRTYTGTATAGWYRIAVSSASIINCNGIFMITGAYSGYHTALTLEAGISYGVTASAQLTALGVHNYANAAFTQARIVYHTTYSSNYAYLEVYQNVASAVSYTVQLLGGTGWSLYSSTTAGSIPSGYSNKAITFTNGSITTSGSFIGAVSGNATTATNFSSAASVTLSGDVTGSASSTKGWSITTTLASSGVSAGSYGPSANASPAHSGTFSVPYITVDAKGRVTSASTKTITLPAIYSLPTASSSTLGGVKTTSTVTSTSGYTACPIISGVPYYKDSNTDVNVTTTANTATTTYLSGSTSSSTTTGTLVKDGAASVVGTTGTTSAVGTTRLILGNSTASGTANNKQGWVRRYGSGAYYLDTTTTVTANTTGYDVYRTSTSATGSAYVPIYAAATGALTQCSNPSMLVNLGSTSAASVFASAPRPGITGTLAVGHGGTGATTASAALTNLGAAASDIVTVSTTEPTSSTCKIWINA